MQDKSAFGASTSGDWRCSPWTMAQAVDPIGSAGEYDTFLVVELPLPWPKDISEVPELAHAATARKRTRVQAVLPDQNRAPRRRLVTVWHREPHSRNGFRGYEHEIGDQDLPSLLDVLVEQPTASLASSVGPPPRELLICTHGKRDACCGKMGTRLSIEVAHRWTGIRVRRCSHTGGHRFAPTAYTFPEGRAWAHLDSPRLDQLIHRRGDVADLHTHQRGAAGLDPWTQVVERSVFEHLGWDWLDCTIIDVRVDVHDLGASVSLRWRWPDAAIGAARGDVHIARHLAVLVCGEPPDSAKKSEPELALTNFEIHPRT